MNATHAEAPDENSRSAARRLLERLCVFGEPLQPPRRDPVGDMLFRHRLLARADAARAAFVLLLIVILAATTIGPTPGNCGLSVLTHCRRMVLRLGAALLLSETYLLKDEANAQVR